MTKQIKVKSLLKTETAYDKDMTIEVDGKELRVIVHWDDHDGFDIQWLDGEKRWVNEPDWATAIDEAGEMSVGYFLDSLNTDSEVTL